MQVKEKRLAFEAQKTLANYKSIGIADHDMTLLLLSLLSPEENIISASMMTITLGRNSGALA